MEVGNASYAYDKIALQRVFTVKLLCSCVSHRCAAFEDFFEGRSKAVLLDEPVSSKSNREIALAFLKAYWNADLNTALADCAPESIIELTRSLPILTPAPISVVLPLMFRDIYIRFRGERFETEICNTISEGECVMVEYMASGILTNGCEFKCRYAVVFTFDQSQIVKVHAYADTRYVAAPLID